MKLSPHTDLRNTAKALLNLEHNSRNLCLIEMDVNSDSSVQTAFKTIADQIDQLDTVFNNAGILDWDTLGQNFH